MRNLVLGKPMRISQTTGPQPFPALLTTLHANEILTQKPLAAARVPTEILTHH